MPTDKSPAPSSQPKEWAKHYPGPANEWNAEIAPKPAESPELAIYLALKIPEHVPLRGDRSELKEVIKRLLIQFRATSSPEPERIDIPFCEAPCGHSSQYTYTEDGGKTMECLVCEVKRLRTSSPELPRRTESRVRLRQALTDCHLACADAVRALDADDERDIPVTPFGFDNDHI